MDLRLTFNTNTEGYDRLRPRYAPEMFEDVIRFAGLQKGMSALEIGIGTGQATLPFLQTGCVLTAVEIGDKMAQVARDKFAGYQGFTVVNQDFESADLEEDAYELIYAATSFHWIPEEIGLPKVRRLLRHGGVFAWISNHPAPSQEHERIHDGFQKVYGRYAAYFTAPLTTLRDRQREIEGIGPMRTATLARYGFADIEERLYEARRFFDAQSYVALLNTYSDHIALPEDVRLPFLQEITDIIDEHGGKFSLTDTVILCMGKSF